MGPLAERFCLVSRTRVLVGVVVVAAAVVAGGVVLLGGRSSSAAPPRHGIGIAYALTPRAALFGDTLEAKVDVLVDPRAVDPDSLQLHADYGVYAQIANPRVTRASVGKLTQLVY